MLHLATRPISPRNLNWAVDTTYPDFRTAMATHEGMRILVELYRTHSGYETKIMAIHFSETSPRPAGQLVLHSDRPADIPALDSLLAGELQEFICYINQRANS